MSRLAITRRPAWLVPTAIAGFLGVAILYPTYKAITAAFVVDGEFGFTAFQRVINDAGFKTMVSNTLLLTGVSSTLGLVLGTLLAVVTTLLPLGRVERSILRFAPIVPLTLPAVCAATGWLFLMAPAAGWVNIGIRSITGSDATSGPFAASSPLVVAWVMGLYSVPFVYTVMASSLSRMNTELLEGYQANGCTMWGALLRAIVGPLRPSFLAACSLAIVECVGQISVPLLLGISTLPTYMYTQINVVGRYDVAAATAMPILVIAVTLTLAQMRFTRQADRWTTVSGRGSSVRHISVGKWSDRGLKAVAYLYFLIAGVAPFLAIITVSLLNYWRPNISFEDLTVRNYVHVWNDELVRLGFNTSLRLGIGCAIVATIIALIITIVGRQVPGTPTKLMYVFADLPFGQPHVLLGLAFLVAFITGPLALYGTIWLLLLAYFVTYLPIAIRNIGPLFQQVGRDMEEAAAVAGAGRLRTLRKITAPLILPGIASSAALLFLMIFREFPIAAFLSTATTRVIAMAIYDYNFQALWSYVAVVALFISMVSIAAFVVANVIISRYNLTRRTSSARRRRKAEIPTVTVG